MLDDERANKVEDGDDDEDDDDNDDDDDETVQSAAIKWQDWAVLRLKSLLPTIHESVFLEFVRDYAVDVEAFFQNDTMCSNVLFIAPVRREIRVITSPTSVDVSAVIEPTDDEAKSAPRKSKTWQRKSSKKKKKSDQKTAKKETKSSPKRIAKAKAVFVPKAETTINVELAAELEQDIRAAGDDQHEHEAGNMNVQLQLHMNDWPDTNEFIFIVRQEYFHGNTQTAAQTDTSEFDERFHLGCVQTGDNCRLADQIIRSILGTATYDVSQQMTQILAYVIGGSSIEPLKASKDIFYDFVLRTVAETLSTKAIQHRLERDPQRHSEQSDSHATAHADSISQLLAAEIGRYCSRLQQQGQSQADDDGDRLCMLKCQLSLFDIDFLADFTLTVGQVDDRFKWATRQLDLIASLSTSDASLQRWLANTIAYLCEFVGRVVASRLARKAKMLSGGGSMSVAEPKKRNEEERMATWLAKDMVSVAAHLHATLSGAISTPAGASEIDRLEAATQLLIPLEEEMERVLDMMARLDDNRRDMARQRAPINEAWGSVQAIGRSIEALSLEGVIEAGNTEALRDLCRQVGDAAEKLQQQIDELQ